MRFTHDCDDCQSLGEHGVYDLYYCPKSDEGSIIARYGSKGSEYTSMSIPLMFSVRGLHHALREGLMRQLKKWVEVDRAKICQI